MKELMKKILFGLLLAAAFSATVRAADHAADEAALRKSSDEFVASWNKNDYKALAAKFTSDADLINPAGRQAKGSAEIEKLFQDEQTTVMKGSSFSNTVRSIQWVSGPGRDLGLGDHRDARSRRERAAAVQVHRDDRLREEGRQVAGRQCPSDGSAGPAARRRRAREVGSRRSNIGPGGVIRRAFLFQWADCSGAAS
jgi:hypothetical protein